MTAEIGFATWNRQVVEEKFKENGVTTSGYGQTAIELCDISKFYSGVTALDEANVTFYSGEVHAILGENGAGKSTLMSIISGATHPDIGKITIEGQTLSRMSPEIAARFGIAISFQHPAILDDLSVLENLRVALPGAIFARRPAKQVAQEFLDSVGLDVDLHSRAETLTVAQKHLLEIAKALAIRPKVLILDEPTASLDQDATDMLFGRIRDLVQTGTSIIYITHRLAELRQIAHRVTVLRDGKVRGTSPTEQISDADLLEMIIGRKLGSTFPAKSKKTASEANFSVSHLGGNGFKDVNFDAAPGQIIGIAGVAGNGQSELMRALAGLKASDGLITLKGEVLSKNALVENAAFMPSDRHIEGLASALTVRENAAFSSLEKFSSRCVMGRKKELTEVRAVLSELDVKAPNIESPILSLSGGNQQKVIMARALLSKPGFIVADEPTQGVDVGARAEIYRILREVSNAGTPVIINSSDAAELEGLCDKVIVLSRGQVIEILEGDLVVEARIVAAAVNAGPAYKANNDHSAGTHKNSLFGRFFRSDNAPALPLALVAIVLGLYVFSQNENFFSAFNIYNILLLATALGFIALGQTVALLMGGIDLSVGPLAGFLVVVASFFINDDKSGYLIMAGFSLMVFLAIVVGSINGLLIRFANFTPIAATLTLYVGLQGMSFLLREFPGGYINYTVTDWINSQLGPIPVSFIVLVLTAILAEFMLRFTRPGWNIRAVGSNPEASRRIGIRIDRTFISGYIFCAFLTAMGSVMLMTQIGVGDPRQGINYTLLSITAVVLGGTSLIGGRGTFIGTLIGAVLLTEVLNAIVFLGLTQTYQYLFQGGLVVVAAIIYTAIGRRSGTKDI